MVGAAARTPAGKFLYTACGPHPARGRSNHGGRRMRLELSKRGTRPAGGSLHAACGGRLCRATCFDPPAEVPVVVPAPHIFFLACCTPTHGDAAPAHAPPGSSAGGPRLHAHRYHRLALPASRSGRARDRCGPCACAAEDSPPDDCAPGQAAAAKYYGAGGAMDKRLPKVEAAVNGCRDAGAFALIDGLACNPHVATLLPAAADLASTQATTSAPPLGGGFLRRRFY